MCTRVGFAVFVGFVLVQSVSLALADEGASPAGHWEGKIDLPGAELPVMFDFESGEHGVWSGDMDIPAQGVRNQTVTGMTVEGTQVTFNIPEFPGGPSFTLTLSEDGEQLTGHMSQAGQELALTLARAEAPPELSHEELYGDYEKPGVPGEGLEGTWRGLIASGPARLRLILHVTGTDDGGYDAKLDSVDQGADGIEVDGVTLDEEGAVSLELMIVNAVFDGKLNDDGSEISGTWQQGGGSVPLTFKRGG